MANAMQPMEEVESPIATPIRMVDTRYFNVMAAPLAGISVCPPSRALYAPPALDTTDFRLGPSGIPGVSDVQLLPVAGELLRP
jgi:hypothetical protein